MKNKLDEKLRYLSIFHYVHAGLTALISCLFIIHVIIGSQIVSGKWAMEKMTAPADNFGWIFVIFGGIAVLSGWTLAGLMVATGRFLQQRRNRMFCIVIAALECCLVPTGTILGVFTIVILNEDKVRKLFGKTKS